MTKIASSGNALSVALCLSGCREGYIRCRRCIVELDHGRYDRDRHREHRLRRCTSLMRHFIELTLAPALLPSCVPPSSTTGALVAGAGASVRRAPGHRRALAGTIYIAPITPAADAHRHAAAPAAIQPVALFPHLHRTPPQDWTAPCFAGINTVRRVAPTGISPLEAREFLTGFPGLRCFGVACSLSGNGYAPHEREIQQKKTKDRSFCRRWRQTALALHGRRGQQTEDEPRSITGAPAINPRLSPESGGFRSPSTASHAETVHHRRLCSDVHRRWRQRDAVHDCDGRPLFFGPNRQFERGSQCNYER